MEEFQNKESQDQRRERIKDTVSIFIEAKLREAIQLKKLLIGEDKDVDIIECLKRIWPENDGVPWEHKPRFIIPDLGEELTIRFGEYDNEYDETSKTMSLGIGVLRNKVVSEDLDNAVENVIEAAYHESEHIYNPGSDIEPEGIEDTIAYLGNPAEIEAHARQFAYRYRHEYPNQLFDIQKMKTFAQMAMDRGIGNKYFNYFIAFADPSKQEKYKGFGDLKSIYEKIVESTQKHVNNFKSSLIPSTD